MFAKTWGLRSLPITLPVTLALSVWSVYALDRLIDSRANRPRASLMRRHHFHRRFRWFFILGIAATLYWVIFASLTILSQTVLMYGAFVTILSGCYFVLAFVQKPDESTGLFKNFVAGLTFAYGTAAGVHAYAPSLSFVQMIFSWEVVLFGMLCAINMTAIDFWELQGEDEEDASALIGMATLILAGISLFFATRGDAWAKPFHYAIVTGAGGIYLLNKLRANLDQDARRLWVDLALLAPVLLFWVWTTYYESAIA